MNTPVQFTDMFLIHMGYLIAIWHFNALH